MDSDKTKAPRKLSLNGLKALLFTGTTRLFQYQYLADTSMNIHNSGMHDFTIYSSLQKYLLYLTSVLDSLLPQMQDAFLVLHVSLK